eukprot:327466-Prymnesium_polylepis.1
MIFRRISVWAHLTWRIWQPSDPLLSGPGGCGPGEERANGHAPRGAPPRRMRSERGVSRGARGGTGVSRLCGSVGQAFAGRRATADGRACGRATPTAVTREIEG